MLKSLQPPKYWKVGHGGAPLEIRDLITVFWVFAHIENSEKTACVKIGLFPPDFAQDIDKYGTDWVYNCGGGGINFCKFMRP